MSRLYLVTGFLGSGKTSLLKHILSLYANRHRIAVIQNEFAPAGTDGKELQQSGEPFRLVEVNNGSVFCVCMLGTFTRSLEKLVRAYQPELIFLEASGLSDPINIIELLRDPAIRDRVALARIISIVDAPHFRQGLQMMPRVRHQVMVADTVLINKIDQYQGDKKSLQEEVRAINPFAAIRETTYCRFDPEDLDPIEARPQEAAAHFGEKESEGRPGMKASVMRVHDRISPDGLDRFVEEIRKESPRIKGFVNTTDGKVVGIQAVFSSYNKEVIPGYQGPTEVIAFGEDLTPGKLRKTFLTYVRP